MSITSTPLPSLQEIALQHDTDKTISNTYIANFERHFGHLRNDPLKVLEVGVLRGGSLLTWRDYFPHATIVGLDIDSNPFRVTPDRIVFYQGNQTDASLLRKIARESAPEGFDIVIDDASHIGTFSRATFSALFRDHVKAGGIYVLEDWCTGYWPRFPDGAKFSTDGVFSEKSPDSILRRAVGRLFRSWAPTVLRKDLNFASHNFGMVGLVKELVDEVAWSDVTDPVRGNSRLAGRKSLISEVTIYCGHAFITRAQ